MKVFFKISFLKFRKKKFPKISQNFFTPVKRKILCRFQKRSTFGRGFTGSQGEFKKRRNNFGKVNCILVFFSFFNCKSNFKCKFKSNCKFKFKSKSKFKSKFKFNFNCKSKFKSNFKKMRFNNEFSVGFTKNSCKILAAFQYSTIFYQVLI